MTQALLWPWQTLFYERLRQAHAQRPAHALLLQAAAGHGGEQFVRALAMHQLCQGDAALACGQCRSCQLFLAGTHPDFLSLLPEETDAPIKVDAVRQVVGFLQQRAQFGGWRVVLIEPAERMNVQAANALLKTLEEPGERVLLLLLSERPSELLATVRSRCQAWILPRASGAQAQDWLQTQGGGEWAGVALQMARAAPLRAQALLAADWPRRRSALWADVQALHSGRRDAIAVAATWKSWGDTLILADILAQWVEDLLRCRLGRTEDLHHPDLVSDYDSMVTSIQTERLHAFWQRLIALRRDLAGHLQLQLLLETLALDIARWSRRGGLR